MDLDSCVFDLIGFSVPNFFMIFIAAIRFVILPIIKLALSTAKQCLSAATTFFQIWFYLPTMVTKINCGARRPGDNPYRADALPKLIIF
mmetsp:Transcript_6967/g.10581  ORF Transcript_6967/g.10581 Transcript_6967/m.10581 type:complete len:89 (+) Transcript_6967:151-417(+)